MVTGPNLGFGVNIRERNQLDKSDNFATFVRQGAKGP